MSALLIRIGLSGLFLTLGALAADRALRDVRRPARGVWIVGMAATVATTLLLLSGGSLPLGVPRAVVDVVAGSGGGVGVAAQALGSGSKDSPVERLVLAWGALTALLLLAYVIGAALQKRRLRAGVSRRVAGVEVLVTRCLGPAVAGLLRPLIIVPGWLLELPVREQRLVVRHEAEHAAAGDHVLSTLALLLCCLLPWNPLLWYQLHRLRLAVEFDCDARVLRRDARASIDYGMLLIHVAERMARGTAFATALVHPRSFLERRIEMITRRSIRPIHAIGWALGAAVLIAAACADATDPTAADSGGPASAVFQADADDSGSRVDALLREQAEARYEMETPMAAQHDGGEPVGARETALPRPSGSTMRTRAPRLERTGTGETNFRLDLDEQEPSSGGSYVVRFRAEVDSEGRPIDIDVEPGTPADMEDRALQSLQSVRFRRSGEAAPDEPVEGFITLP